MELDDIPGMGDSRKKDVVVAAIYLGVFFGIIGNMVGDPDTGSTDGVETNGNGDEMEQAQNEADTDEGGEGGTESESYSEQFGISVPDNEDRRLAQEAALEGYANSNDMYKNGLREVDFIPQMDGGYIIEVRYDLRVPEFGGLEDNAEQGGGTVTRDIVQSVANSDAENVVEVYTYGYVPTQDGGDTVAHSVGVRNIDRYEETRPWQDLRDASEYNFNDYLF